MTIAGNGRGTRVSPSGLDTLAQASICANCLATTPAGAASCPTCGSSVAVLPPVEADARTESTAPIPTLGSAQLRRSPLKGDRSDAPSGQG